MKQLSDIENMATKSSTLISMLLKHGPLMDQADFFTLLEIASDLSCDVSGYLIEQTTSHNDIKDSSLVGNAVETSSHKKCVQPEPCSSFPLRLKYAMKVSGLTQKELAERAGVSQSVISRLITGKDKTGTRSGVLSHALGVSFDWLHYGTGEMYSANFSADNREV